MCQRDICLPESGLVVALPTADHVYPLATGLWILPRPLLPVSLCICLRLYLSLSVTVLKNNKIHYKYIFKKYLKQSLPEHFTVRADVYRVKWTSVSLCFFLHVFKAWWGVRHTFWLFCMSADPITVVIPTVTSCRVMTVCPTCHLGPFSFSEARFTVHRDIFLFLTLSLSFSLLLYHTYCTHAHEQLCHSNGLHMPS